MAGVIDVWRIVFGNWRYSLLAVVIAMLFYLINVLISNFKTIIGFYSLLGFLGSIKFFFNLAIGFKNLIILSSFISLIIISVLLGLSLSLLIFKTRAMEMKNKRLGIFGGLGIFFGVLAPGCAACGLGLLPLLGLSAIILNFLPLKGLEISLLAIVILSITTFKISKSLIKCDACQIKIKSERR